MIKIWDKIIENQVFDFEFLLTLIGRISHDHDFRIAIGESENKYQNKAKGIFSGRGH